MTRFEALGVLSDKWITGFREVWISKQAQTDAEEKRETRLKRDHRISHEQFVDNLPGCASFRLCCRPNQRRLGYLIRIIVPTPQGLRKTYVKADTRKLRKNARLFGWTLPGETKK